MPPARVSVHIVFSTRDRKPFITDAVRSHLHAYIAGAANAEHVVLCVGGTTDHVHVAVFLSRTDSIAKLVERLKVSSWKWIKMKRPEYAKFAWQKGYAVFRSGWVIAELW